MSIHIKNPEKVPFIAIIPARLASTRLPNKPLADIAGKPMVIRVAERAIESNALKVIIATDAKEIIDIANAYGIEAMLTHTNHLTGTDRITEVIEKLQCNDETIIVNVQGDEPLIDPQLIEFVAKRLYQSSEYAIATAASLINNWHDLFDQNIVKTVLDKNGQALYFSRAPIPWMRDIFPYYLSVNEKKIDEITNKTNMPSDCFFRHIGLYAYRARFLRQYKKMMTHSISPLEKLEKLEQLGWLWHGERIIVHITKNTPPLGVDTYEDLTRVRNYFAL